MKRDLKIKAAYRHPPELVWEALTNPEDIAQWLMENDFKPEVGHEFTLRTDPAPGFDGIVRCKVLEVDPLRRLSYTWKGGPIDTVLTFELERVEGSEAGTVLHVTQSGFTGFKAVLVSLILGAGSRKIYNRLLPALLDRKAGTATAPLDEKDCERGVWKVLAVLFAPVLGSKRPLAAAVAAGLLLFLFNAVSWLALPFHGESLHDLPGGTERFVAQLPASGVYHYPGHTSDEQEMKARLERARKGPVVTLMVVSKEGLDPMAPGRFAVTLLLDIAAAFAAALVLARVGGGFGHRFGVAVLLGVFLAVGGRAQDWLWWSQPTGFALPGVIDAVLGWTLAGAVLAAIVRPAQR